MYLDLGTNRLGQQQLKPGPTVLENGSEIHIPIILETRLEFAGKRAGEKVWGERVHLLCPERAETQNGLAFQHLFPSDQTLGESYFRLYFTRQSRVIGLRFTNSFDYKPPPPPPPPHTHTHTPKKIIIFQKKKKKIKITHTQNFETTDVSLVILNSSQAIAMVKHSQICSLYPH